MKKIGIITISRTDNYGAELQAFALQKRLSLNGFDNVETIDYPYYKNSRFIPTKESRPDFMNKTQRVKEFLLYRLVSPLIEGLGKYILPAIRRKQNNFEKFYKKSNMIFSEEYRSIKDLYSAKHDYDVFIVGSDQVWNPLTGSSLKPYFLTFASNDKIKIAYASSFGVGDISKDKEPVFRNYLNNLDYISVREKQGIGLVKKICGKDAVNVLDPTLLLTKQDWQGVVGDCIPNIKGKYVLMYVAGENEKIYNVAIEVGRMLDLPIIKICRHPYLNKKIQKIQNILDAGPLEFLNYFMHASFIISNSFHGTAFSVNFNVPFYSVISSNKKNNSRITDFLNLVGLYNRIIFEDDNSLNINPNVDFSKANIALNSERNKSLKYLIDAIE